MLALRRQTVDRALEAVEDVHITLNVHLERHVVVVPANLTVRHSRSPLAAFDGVGPVG
jgi:hypothetical protein